MKNYWEIERELLNIKLALDALVEYKVMDEVVAHKFNLALEMKMLDKSRDELEEARNDLVRMIEERTR